MGLKHNVAASSTRASPPIRYPEESGGLRKRNQTLYGAPTSKASSGDYTARSSGALDDPAWQKTYGGHAADIRRSLRNVRPTTSR